MYEMGRAAMTPWRAAVNAGRNAALSPMNPFFETPAARTWAAAAEVFERASRAYNRPDWMIETAEIGGSRVPVSPETIFETPWMELTWFRREAGALKAATGGKAQPKLLLVAPMSGHYATLLRGTVEAFLPDFEVFITEWKNARAVPLSDGRFDLNDYVDHVIDALHVLGPQTHVAAVCQPGPLVLAATAVMADNDDPCTPASMTHMGSPIDARRSPTVPNVLAMQRPLSWFRDNLVHTTPPPYPGALRRVYPGFLQLMSFMNMNWDRHVDAHWSFFEHLVDGDGDSAEKHREFYDEYLAVMDLSEEFYVQTVDEVFQQFTLARGKMMHRGQRVRPQAITKTALMTVEGENDDISGIGQTQAAHDLCENIPEEMRLDHVQDGVGHYGVFNGRRFREEIAPCMKGFMCSHWDEKADLKARPDFAALIR